MQSHRLYIAFILEATEAVYFLCYGCINCEQNEIKNSNVELDSGRIIEQPCMPPDGIRWPNLISEL